MRPARGNTSHSTISETMMRRRSVVDDIANPHADLRM
jgi:hypothetical protein